MSDPFDDAQAKVDRLMNSLQEGDRVSAEQLAELDRVSGLVFTRLKDSAVEAASLMVRLKQSLDK